MILFLSKMDYRAELKNPASIGYIDIIVAEAMKDADSFSTIFELSFDADKSIAWKAAWVCNKICRINPEVITPERRNRITNEVIHTKHNGVLRSMLSILVDGGLPAQIPVEFINLCFERMVSPKGDVSHQVLSMKLLYQICLAEPAFAPELTAYLENISPADYTPGFNTTRKKILKLLYSRHIA